jgi:putative transposase
MSHSYSAICLHAVFATRERSRLIPPDRTDDLYAFMGGIARNLGCRILRAGGTPNHVHLLISIPAKLPAAVAIQKLKANSSRFIGEDFGWQEGYGVFAVSASQIETVKRYIANQQVHHLKHTFEEEFAALLRAYGLTHSENGAVADAIR